LQRSHHSSNGPSPIDRKIEDRGEVTPKCVSRDFLTSYGGGGNDHTIGRKFFQKSAHQRTRGLSLADRNAMDPDQWSIFRDNLWQLAETLTKTRDVLAAAQRVDRKLRRQRDEANGQKQAVKQVHSLEFNFSSSFGVTQAKG